MRRLARAFRLPPSARVLDIGSGDSPFPPSDVVCEKFPWDDRERTAPFRRDRPLVIGDVEALPFRDGAFDFIHCSHVLEHTFQPNRAIAEMMRVGRAGYIEVPSSYLEKTCHSTPSHLWFIDLENGELVFRPKPRGTLDPALDRIFRERLLDRDPLYSAFHYARLYDLYHIGLFWERTIGFRVEGLAQSPASSRDFEKGSTSWRHGEPGHEPVARERTSGVKRWIHKRAQQAKPGFTLEDFLACPFCQSSLESQAGSRLRCVRCAVAFPYQNGSPVLLREAAA